MKRLVTLTSLSLAFAIGSTACAHHQLSGNRTKDGLIGAAVFAGVIAAAMLLPCDECKSTDFGIPQNRARPPR